MGPGTTGINRANWERQNKVTTLMLASWRCYDFGGEALDWVASGTYTLTSVVGPTSFGNAVVVQKVTNGVKVGSVRK